MSKVITFVVPAGSGGVRDYADIMASQMRMAGYDARVFAWSKRQAQDIDAHILASDCLYLQYSGYGYAKRGAPLWMLRYLQARRPEIKRFGVFFHELYATGPVWGSAFWLSPWQRHIAAALVALADFWVTNRHHASCWLSRYSRAVPAATLPVCSNVGESQGYAAHRHKIAVVFGSAARRRNTYMATGDPLFEWAARNQVELHDIGPSMEATDTEMTAILARHEVICHGRLAEQQIHELFSKAMFGILACSIQYVEKSGVFAAYCAHGMAPILISPDYFFNDAVCAGSEYLSSDAFNHDLNQSDIDAVARAAWGWYQNHSITAHVHKLMEVESTL